MTTSSTEGVISSEDYEYQIKAVCKMVSNRNHAFGAAAFFTELILRIGFTSPPAMAAKPTLLNKSCSNQKIVADLLFQLKKLLQ